MTIKSKREPWGYPALEATMPKSLQEAIKANRNKEDWKLEPNEKIWTYRGYKCVIRRMPHMGQLNGYVILPKGHKYYKKNYDDIPIEVHGGLTFGGKLTGIEGYCVGFDCAHCGDYIPKMNRRIGIPEVYRDMNYVTKQCESMVRQLKKLDKKRRAPND